MSRPYLVVLVFTLVYMPSIAFLTTEPAKAVETPERAIGDRSGRTQFGAVGSGSLLVWEDRIDALLQYSDLGSSDLFGLDVATNRAFTVTDAPGVQTMPAIAGSLVVWQDHRHGCHTCDADIRGKDLAAGIEYVIADGPAHQVVPAISGRTVAWIEQTGTPAGGVLQQLISIDLDTRQRTIIVTAPAGPTLGRPQISDTYLVWAELTPGNRTINHNIRAYDRKSGQVSQIAESEYIGTEYALAGKRLVLTLPHVQLVDLPTGTTRQLASHRATTPRIGGDWVVWSAHEAAVSPDLHIEGYDLRTEKRSRLVVVRGRQSAPLIVGDQLIWQREEGQRNRLVSAPLADAHAGSLDRPITTQALDEGTIDGTDDGYLTAAAVLRKGIHAAHGDGWFNSNGLPCTNGNNGPAGTCQALDSLGAPNAPRFGAVLALSSDLERSTGRSASWGASVKNAMQYLQNSSVRVVIRTYPQMLNGQLNDYPHPIGQQKVSPIHVKNHISHLKRAENYPWIRQMQIHNEPNQPAPGQAEGAAEWLIACSQCVWDYAPGGGFPEEHYNVSWYGPFDPNFYYAISVFYDQVLGEIRKVLNNNPNDRLAGTDYWSPPLADIFRPLDNGQNMYDAGIMPQMISDYSRFTYHTYPSVNYESDPLGGVESNSYVWMPQWLKNRVDGVGGPILRSMITELGWNPGQMNRCNISQHTAWASSHGDPGCRPSPYSGTYYFDNTINGFLTNPAKHHNAEAIFVWLVRGPEGGSPDQFGVLPDLRSEGVTRNGIVRPWFVWYQNWFDHRTEHPS
jgi:hypothetical protein